MFGVFGVMESEDTESTKAMFVIFGVKELDGLIQGEVTIFFGDRAGVRDDYAKKQVAFAILSFAGFEKAGKKDGFFGGDETFEVGF